MDHRPKYKAEIRTFLEEYTGENFNKCGSTKDFFKTSS